MTREAAHSEVVAIVDWLATRVWITSTGRRPRAFGAVSRLCILTVRARV
jgi:hypothetical protein